MTKLKLSELAKALEDGERVEYKALEVDTHLSYSEIKDANHLARLFTNTIYDIRIAPKPFKPDLSCLVGSDVLCEFWDSSTATNKMIGKLSHINNNHYKFSSANIGYHKCQPALDHWQVHHGGKCPLPEGALVEVRSRDTRIDDSMAEIVEVFDWSHREGLTDIIAYKFTGWEE